MGLSRDIIINNKYIIKNKVGEGNFGKIFIGKNKYTDEEIAIKIDTNPIILKNEAVMYNYLSDVNGIPKLRAFGKEGKYNFLILDLLGDTLISKRERSSDIFTLDYVIGIGIKLIKIINNINEKNIIHRDIKPSNLLINHNGEVKVSDFGIVREMESTVAKANTFVGTLTYMSPERISGEAYSYASDLWSFGLSILVFRTLHIGH